MRRNWRLNGVLACLWIVTGVLALPAVVMQGCSQRLARSAATPVATIIIQDITEQYAPQEPRAAALRAAVEAGDRRAASAVWFGADGLREAYIGWLDAPQQRFDGPGGEDLRGILRNNVYFLDYVLATGAAK
jgi:hypothetical protein